MMKLGVLALDYEGTLADSGPLHPELRAVLGEARRRGIPVVLVTERIFEDVRDGAGDLTWADAVVAENGALVAFDGGYERVLAPPPAPRLLGALVKAGIRFRTGKCVVEADGGDAPRLLELVRQLALPAAVVFDGPRALVLPHGVCKSSGLREVLRTFRLSPHNALAVGDGENDADLLATCEVGAAVAWGSPSLLESADDVVPGRGPSDVAAYLRSAIAGVRLPEPRARRRRVTLGRIEGAGPVCLEVRERNLLVAGDPRSGKSWVTGLLCEQLAGLGYSLCIVDPEGDYAPLEALPGVVFLGGAGPPPRPRDVVSALHHPDVSVVVDLSKLSHADKVAYLRVLLPLVAQLRRRSGLPHGIVLDEAHYFLHQPDAHDAVDLGLGGYILVTYRVSDLDRSVVAAMDALIVTHASEPREVRTLRDLAGAGAEPGFAALVGELPIDEAVVIRMASSGEPVVDRFRLAPRFTAHVRHRAKYRDVPLPPQHAFVFTRCGSPTGTAARTLAEFVAGVRESAPEVVAAHAQRGDFSRWLADVFGDQPLASEIAALEADNRGHAIGDLKTRVVDAICLRYEIATVEARV